MVFEGNRRIGYGFTEYTRWFYYAFDKIENADAFLGLQERIENIYFNTWLQSMVLRWNKNLTREAMEKIGITSQERFYERFLRPYEGKERAIVIISDD